MQAPTNQTRHKTHYILLYRNGVIRGSRRGLLPVLPTTYLSMYLLNTYYGVTAPAATDTAD